MNWFKLSLLPANITFCTHILPFLTTVACYAVKKWLHLGTKADILGSKQKV